MELWDCYLPERVKTGETAVRGQPIPAGLFRLVVHICIFNSRGEMLIQRRQPFKDKWPDLWDVTVGGSAVAGESSQSAASRELEEELGLKLDLTGVQPHLTVNFPSGFDDVYLVNGDVDLGECVLQPEEVAAVRWASLEEILSMINAGTFIPYRKSLIRLYFELRESHDVILKRPEEERRAALRQAAGELPELRAQLREQKKQGKQQAQMIAALASDCWSVYCVELERDRGVCYQAHGDLENGLRKGQAFPYLQTAADYAGRYVTEKFREEFLRFVQPENLRERLREQRIVSFRYMVRRHGQDTYEMVRVAGMRQPEDPEDMPVSSVVACFMDVDAETRQTLEQSQALTTALTAAEEASKAKTAFLSNMSHEIRTPINAIIGLNSIALNDPEVPEKTRGYLEKMDASAIHLMSIINEILDMSRIESGRMVIKSEEFSFSKTLEQVNAMISAQCRDKGLEYECRILGQADGYYIGDDMKLRQVLLNILGNAVKFTPAGGRVTFTVEETARFGGSATLRFVIQDTGIGMSKEFLPKLFETFSQEDSSTTNRFGSTGLGMPITKSLLELMNGSIEVESEKGVGSTFTVTVPLGQSGRREGEDEGLRPEELRVLVIDDDPIACEHAAVILSQAGIENDTALSGPEALELVKLRHARREPFSLILVDWKMPELDGVETARQIRSLLGQDSPVILLTSYSWEDVVEEAGEAGVDGFIPKPLFLSAVLEEYRSAYRRKQTAAPALRADLTGRRVLLAEDIAINAEITIMVLETREVTTEHALNGKLAVEMFASHPAGYYDAILMDMRMPEMDGLEATRTIRAMDRPDAKAVPIIALTANAFDEDVQRSMQAGLNAHLTKPVEPEVLFETLETLIRP